MKYEKFQSIQSPCQQNIITKQITAQDKNIAVDFLCLIFRFVFFFQHKIRFKTTHWL